ncbi:hypothetical protein BB559_004487 [Furculomyces boomerangus]|uniref:BHLH domain-containing protein n=1 Tax=Furculomyces boomerangus TaxID=61424 RepID=A0A2T9YEF9_9FUNG|nr:hypothetical protein BB559_004487 [Furculomyces boomerangus]
MSYNPESYTGNNKKTINDNEKSFIFGRNNGLGVLTPLTFQNFTNTSEENMMTNKKYQGLDNVIEASINNNDKPANKKRFISEINNSEMGITNNNNQRMEQLMKTFENGYMPSLNGNFVDSRNSFGRQSSTNVPSLGQESINSVFSSMYNEQMNMGIGYNSDIIKNISQTTNFGNGNIGPTGVISQTGTPNHFQGENVLDTSAIGRANIGNNIIENSRFGVDNGYMKARMTGNSPLSSPAFYNAQQYGNLTSRITSEGGGFYNSGNDIQYNTENASYFEGVDGFSGDRSNFGVQNLSLMGLLDGNNMEMPHKRAQIIYEKKQKRRESHNAVERRRRDHINERIQELYELIPSSMKDPATKPNKGLILRLACEYIKRMHDKTGSAEIDSGNRPEKKNRETQQKSSSELKKYNSGGNNDIDTAVNRNLMGGSGNDGVYNNSKNTADNKNNVGLSHGYENLTSGLQNTQNNNTGMKIGSLNNNNNNDSGMGTNMGSMNNDNNVHINQFKLPAKKN